MNIIVATDSYKGCLSSKKVGLIIKNALLNELPNANVEVIPMSDGGEGFVDSLVYATKGKKIPLKTTGPLGKEIQAYYGVLGDNQTVIIEIAQIVGLHLVPNDKLNPLNSTTYGIGEVVKHALDQGYRKFIFGLGGSATNDCGLGMLQALGGIFLNSNKNHVEPYGRSVPKVTIATLDYIDSRIYESEIIIASDVNNLLCGKEGATYIFGPQKGIKAENLEAIDKDIYHFSKLIEENEKVSFSTIPGSGAAGGLGFALLLINAKMRSGAEIVSDLVGLSHKIENSEWVITGEGKSDDQTFYGKVPIFIAKIAKKFNTKTILISGSFDSRIEHFYHYFTSCHSISNGPMSIEESISDAEHLINQCTRNISKIIKASQLMNNEVVIKP